MANLRVQYPHEVVVIDTTTVMCLSVKFALFYSYAIGTSFCYFDISLPTPVVAEAQVGLSVVSVTLRVCVCFCLSEL